MVPSRLTDADVLAIWRRMDAKRRRVRFATATYRVGQHVRTTKENINFAKAAVQNFSTEIFRNVKVIYGRPRVVYTPEDLVGTPTDVQFYQGELTPVRITSRTNYKIDKMRHN